MKDLFTIGEVAKLFNISVKTLRYYESKNLLNPIYINENSGYRYYSRNQFLNLDLIKCFRKVGMSIEEIREIIYSNRTIDLVSETIRKQQEKIQEKLDEIMEVKNYLNEMNNSILNIANYEAGCIVEIYNQRRKAISYIKDINTEDEREEHFRNVILHIEKNYGDINPMLGGRQTYESITKGHYAYANLLYLPRNFKDDLSLKLENIQLNEEVNQKDIKTKEHYLEEGNYLTIVFDDSWKNIDKYYKKILAYIEENKIEVLGDFNEVWVMPRLYNEESIIVLGYIEILCKKK